MATDNEEPRIEDRIYGVDLHPRHEAWARLSVRSSLIGFVIFVLLAAAFIAWVQLH